MAIADRIAGLIKQVSAEEVSAIAIECREKMKLRHIPLFIVREMSRHPTHKHLVARTLEKVIQRPDELSEFLAIYWKEKKQPLSAQVKRGLAAAFKKFNAYSLAKFNQDGAVKLRDVLFLCHAKPDNDEQAATWKKLVDGTLETPDTWEVALSAGKDKKETWERLISEKKLGALATLRNLRNMIGVGVSESVIRGALQNMSVERVLPFRFISAAKYAPNLEPELEACMNKCLAGIESLSGKTILLIDVSGSMSAKVSGRSEISRLDAACGLAILLREMCEGVEVFTFSSALVAVPPRRGFALRDAVTNSQSHASTELGKALNALTMAHDRIIVITDEQSSDQVSGPKAKGYMINVASEKNGVGYGAWSHIDGWSESIVNYIQNLENQ